MLAERKVQKAKIALMRHPKFALLSGILLMGKTYVDETLPTASTNGRDDKYGRAFVDKLDDQELAFVVAHEAAHKMYRHLTTWSRLSEIDRGLTNCACDYVINLMLKDTDPNCEVIRMPTYKDGPLRGKAMGLIDEKFRGMSTKQVFDILREEQEEDGSGGDDGFDDHDWDGAKELTDAEKEELERELDRAIRQGLIAEKRVGKGTGGLSRAMQELTEPVVNWREELREFVKSICAGRDTSTWRKPNRRFLHMDTYMPTLVSEKVGHIVIAIDTSGSIGDHEIADFLSEVKSIADEVHPEMVDLLYWDCEVAAHEKYESNEVPNIVSSTKPRGGGGTSPTCVSSYLKRNDINPECIVVLTDGIVGGDWGSEWTAPVLWGIVSNYKTDIVAGNGKTVHIVKEN